MATRFLSVWIRRATRTEESILLSLVCCSATAVPSSTPIRKGFRKCHRDEALVCVVENIQDVLAIENTQQYNGLYHVLGGVISPMDGIGPNDIEIDSLVERVQAHDEIEEVILALSSTMEGDTTNFYISRKLAPLGVKVSVIARGISVGNELEYTDEVTLGRSIVNRTPFNT